jgi:hypothetical protein
MAIKQLAVVPYKLDCRQEGCEGWSSVSRTLPFKPFYEGFLYANREIRPVLAGR